VKSSLRFGRVSASPRVQLRSGVFRKGVSVTTGTPASAFVALAIPRLSFSQRKFDSVPRTVASRLVASAYPDFPRYTLKGVFEKVRRAAQNETLLRMSERFAGQIEPRKRVMALSLKLLVKPRRHARRKAQRRWLREIE